MRLLLVWLLNAIALLAVAYLFPGVQIQDWHAAQSRRWCSASSTR